MIQTRALSVSLRKRPPPTPGCQALPCERPLFAFRTSILPYFEHRLQNCVAHALTCVPDVGAMSGQN